MKKRKKKRHSKFNNSKKIILIIILGFLLLLAIWFIISNQSPSTGKSVQQIDVVPLNPEQKQKVIDVLSSSEFVNDIPKNSPISIRFFSFSGEQRIWNDGFLIGEGEPVIYLILHSKYISELNENNLCEIIKKANENRDLGFYSEYSKARLLLKYSGMLKYRKCFGF